MQKNAYLYYPKSNKVAFDMCPKNIILFQNKFAPHIISISAYSPKASLKNQKYFLIKLYENSLKLYQYLIIYEKNLPMLNFMSQNYNSIFEYKFICNNNPSIKINKKKCQKVNKKNKNKTLIINDKNNTSYKDNVQKAKKIKYLESEKAIKRDNDENLNNTNSSENKNNYLHNSDLTPFNNKESIINNLSFSIISENSIHNVSIYSKDNFSIHLCDSFKILSEEKPYDNNYYSYNYDNKVRYVYISRTGKKYHGRKMCGRMKTSKRVTLSRAEGIGLSPCLKCY